MAKLKDYWFYHGTTLNSAKQILKNGFKMSSRINSLGVGSYAFACIRNNAKTFALRRSKYNKEINESGDKIKPCIVKFKLLHPELILDFTNPLSILSYDLFTETHRRKLTYLISHHRNDKPGIKKLDGAVLESFLSFINKESSAKHFLGVYNLTQNDLYGTTIPFSQIPNSMELAFRSNLVINKDTLTLDKI